MNRKVSIIIPVIRPAKAQRCIGFIRENAGVPCSQYEILTEEDTERIGCPKMVKRLTDRAKHEMVMFLGDDTLPQKGFLLNALRAMKRLPDEWGLVGLNDFAHDGDKTFSTHWVASKKLLPYLGGEFFCTQYIHCYCDLELTDRCRELGRYTWAKDAQLLHEHPMLDYPGAGLNPKTDDDYKRVYAPQNKIRDLQVYKKRKRAGWPNANT